MSHIIFLLAQSRANYIKLSLDFEQNSDTAKVKTILVSDNI